METSVLEGYLFPLSYAQQRLWFLDQLAPGSTAYSVPAGLRLLGPLSVPALETALRTVIARHEVLRTTFNIIDGQPMQIVKPESNDAQLEFTDFSGAAVDPASTMDIAAQDETRRPFDLARGPLVRSHLLRFGPGDHFLLLNMHHIVTDGWSTGIFFRELAAAYEAAASGRDPVLPPLPIQYADYAVWERARMESGRIGECLRYWRHQLEGAPSLAFPTDYFRVPAQDARAAIVEFTIPQRHVAQMRKMSRSEDSTLFMVLLTAFNVVLHYMGGQTDIVVGTDVANRQAETEDLIGFFANQLVLRTSLDGNPRFIDLLRRVRQVTLDAYTHQDMPFDRLVEELQPERSLAYSPLFQAKFVLQNVPQTALALSRLAIEPVFMEPDSAKFDLLINLRESAEEMPGTLHYREDVLSRETARRIAGIFGAAINSIVEDPSIHLDELNARLRSWDSQTSRRRDMQYRQDNRRTLMNARRARAVVVRR